MPKYIIMVSSDGYRIGEYNQVSSYNEVCVCKTRERADELISLLWSMED